MNKYNDFPDPPRFMTEEEGTRLFLNMVDQVADYNPDEIIAVSRSGFIFGAWIAQILKLPLGAYWQDKNLLVTVSNPSKVVFVDDNLVTGGTYLNTVKFMEENHPDISWKWAVLFSDWNTPKHIVDAIIQGEQITYYAEEPFWGTKKVSTNVGVRFRDE